MVNRCASLDEEALSKACREQGIYPHHVEQWRQDFINSMNINSKVKIPSVTKSLRLENKTLAETEALIVLQNSTPKKVSAFWGNVGDYS